MVEWTFIEEAPEAERIWVGVTAREKMSVMCAEEGGSICDFFGGVALLTIVDGVRCEVLFRLVMISCEHTVETIQIPWSPLHEECF